MTGITPGSVPATMRALSTLLSRVDRGTVLSLLPGDVAAILLFVVVGELRHGVDPVTMPGRFAGTAIPFLVGWLVVAPLAGAYAARLRSGLGRLVATTASAWVAAAAVAQVLRATEPFPGDADPVFFLVTVGFGGLLLVGWRLAWTALGPGRRDRVGAGVR